MLTADLVRVRKRLGRLSVSPLTGKTRAQAEQFARVYLQLTAEMVGQTVGQLQEAYSAVEVGPRDKKLAAGLQKLIEDKCAFDEHLGDEARNLRGEVFLLASQARKDQAAAFDRRVVLTQVAGAHGLEAESLEGALFADLRSEHRLISAGALTVSELLQAYDAAQYQAVLLRAVHVTATVRCRAPEQYRALFRALKFRRLMHVIHPAESGYRIEIDGPFSLFESVTKYGLQLALVFPTLCQCDALELTAQIRWGKARESLIFDYKQLAASGAEPAVPVAPELETLIHAFSNLTKEWTVRVNEELLHLPGSGVCIPDLVFERRGERVFLEVMGFWSRAAVWKRVELVESGLPDKIIFAVSTRLRVSEEVLDEEASAALYVYKGTLSARAVLQRLERLAAGSRIRAS